MSRTGDFGEWGELVAIDYLKAQRYFVMDHDWQLDHKDLDIVAIDNETKEIVFVEVKTRSSTYFAQPEEAVDDEKIRNVKSAANAYIRFKKITRQARFDIITVVGTGDDDVTINHIKDAFY